MMLVGDVRDRVCILIDDLIDTGNTITRAAKLLKKEGATAIYALVTHGILSGDAIPRINASAIDKLIVTNTVPQIDHRRLCPKLVTLDGKRSTGTLSHCPCAKTQLLSSISRVCRGHPARAPRRVHQRTLPVQLGQVQTMQQSEQEEKKKQKQNKNNESRTRGTGV